MNGFETNVGIKMQSERHYQKGTKGRLWELSLETEAVVDCRAEWLLKKEVDGEILR